jgi:dolichol-phosphate mannosyltransferase
MRKLISFVIPLYNEEESVDALYEACQPVFREIEKTYDVELIFVNDGSRDRTLAKVLALHEGDDRVKVVNLSRNFGHQWALTAGLDLAEGDAVVVMDGDLQDPPEVSLALIDKWRDGFELVYAQRRTRQDRAFKRWTAYLFYRILDRLSDIPIPKDTGDFRLMDRKVVDTLGQFRERNRFMRGLVSYVGFNQTGILFDRKERYAGQTAYPLRKMIRFALDGITSFSTVPLRLIAQVGFLVSLLSLAGIVYVIVLKLFFPSHGVQGTTLAIISVLFIGGVQMNMIGILGMYIGRIYSEVQRRPLYIVSSVHARGRARETK